MLLCVVVLLDPVNQVAQFLSALSWQGVDDVEHLLVEVPAVEVMAALSQESSGNFEPLLRSVSQDTAGRPCPRHALAGVYGWVSWWLQGCRPLTKQSAFFAYPQSPD